MSKYNEIPKAMQALAKTIPMFENRPTFDQIDPLQDYVLMRRDRHEMTDGGIAIPDRVRDKEGDGVVLAIGPDVKTVRVGDRVMTDPNSTVFEMPKDRSVCLTRETSFIARQKKVDDGIVDGEKPAGGAE